MPVSKHGCSFQRFGLKLITWVLSEPGAPASEVLSHTHLVRRVFAAHEGLHLLLILFGCGGILSAVRTLLPSSLPTPVAGSLRNEIRVWWCCLPQRERKGHTHIHTRARGSASLCQSGWKENTRSRECFKEKLYVVTHAPGQLCQTGIQGSWLGG